MNTLNPEAKVKKFSHCKFTIETESMEIVTEFCPDFDGKASF